MRFFVVEFAVVTTSEHIALLAEVAELAFPTAVMLLIEDVVMLV
jgi:hypothetical protein